MRRICISALVFGAFSVPAFAGPLSITPGTYNAAQGRSVTVCRRRQSRARLSLRPRCRCASPTRRPISAADFIQFLFGGGPQGAAAPQTYPQATAVPPEAQPQTAALGSDPDAATADADDGGHAPVDAKYDRQVVAYTGKETPGTIIVDTPHKFLYLVEDERQGDALWHRCRPPRLHLGGRQNRSPPNASGPIGGRRKRCSSASRNCRASWPAARKIPSARAPCISARPIYRIHGSNEPWTIGHNCLVGLHPAAQRRRHRPLQPRQGRHQSRGDCSATGSDQPPTAALLRAMRSATPHRDAESLVEKIRVFALAQIGERIEPHKLGIDPAGMTHDETAIGQAVEKFREKFA